MTLPVVFNCKPLLAVRLKLSSVMVMLLVELVTSLNALKPIVVTAVSACNVPAPKPVMLMAPLAAKILALDN
ncbi:hypothetical protein LTEGF4_12470 [Limnohabitans sp. TEGF004]|nr:hypothetical protein LTEGF4_12470 [Limnohabitans sp. TEGF004]